MTTLLAHRGTPGLVTRKDTIEEVPTSRSEVRRLKRKYAEVFKSHGRQKRLAISKHISDLKAQKKRVHQSAKSKTREKHLEIEKAYHTQGHGWRWTDLAKSIGWKKKVGRPVGSIGGGAPRYQIEAPRNDPDYDVDAEFAQAQQDPRGYLTTGQSHDQQAQQGGVSYVITTQGSQKALPPGRSPYKMLPPGGGSSYKMLPPGSQPSASTVGTPFTRPTIHLPGQSIDTMKQVGPPIRGFLPAGSTSPRPINAIGSNIRGLLPAAGQTTRLKLQGLAKRLGMDAMK